MYKIAHQSRGNVAHGISTCAGCGMEIVMRNILSVVGEDVILIIPPGCGALFSGCGDETSVTLPGYQCNLDNVASTAAGVRAALDAKGNKSTTVLCFAGDGATVDIGLQALSGMMERGERVLYICYDNEAYMNTGIQGSSSTPMYAQTTTTPSGKRAARKDLVGIAIAHNIPYAATASLSNLPDLRKKVAKAQKTDGPSLLHIHIPCPTGWRYHPSKTVQLARAAVMTGCWALYEYENGKATLNYTPKQLQPLEHYISLQGRFKWMDEAQKQAMQKEIEQDFAALQKRLSCMEG